MKIVVIGGTGLIGSKTVGLLRQAGHEAGCRFAVRAKDRADKNRDLRNGQQPHGDHVKGLHDA